MEREPDNIIQFPSPEERERRLAAKNSKNPEQIYRQIQEEYEGGSLTYIAAKGLRYEEFSEIFGGNFYVWAVQYEHGRELEGKLTNLNATLTTLRTEKPKAYGRIVRVEIQIERLEDEIAENKGLPTKRPKWVDRTGRHDYSEMVRFYHMLEQRDNLIIAEADLREEQEKRRPNVIKMAAIQEKIMRLKEELGDATST